MSISTVSNNDPTSSTNNNANVGAAAAAASVAALSVNDFLTLMTAQLQNQDPTQPLDPSTFVTQLAQFGTVSGIDSMQSSLSQLSSTLLQNQALSSTSLVGHSVLTQASSAQLTSGQSLSGAVQAPAGASSMVVDVTNGSGSLVQQISVPVNSSGLSAFTWDGTTLAGTPAPSGTYTVQAIANVNGVATGAQTYLSGTVTSVSLNPGGSSGITVNTPQLGSVALTSVQQVD